MPLSSIGTDVASRGASPRTGWLTASSSSACARAGSTSCKPFTNPQSASLLRSPSLAYRSTSIRASQGERRSFVAMARPRSNWKSRAPSPRTSSGARTWPASNFPDIILILLDVFLLSNLDTNKTTNVGASRICTERERFFAKCTGGRIARC
jgi:hypothetical protein